MKRLFAGILAILVLVSLWGCAPVEETTPESTTVEPTEELLTGWQVMDGQRCYFSEEGIPLTGWQELEGKRYYFEESGAMVTGWLEQGEAVYYFGVDGVMFTGLLNIQGKGYYFDEDGKRYSGWQDVDGKTRYFDADGVMAVGAVQIDGKQHYFSPHGVEILLVNPWNSLPEDYQVELVEVTGRDRLETACAEALVRMMTDCKSAGHEIMIASAYRTQEEQEWLYWRKVNSLLDAGWAEQEARKEAAKHVALPGTSEHQLGLAVDLMDLDYPALDDNQANTGGQKWLMEHCHEYGFILRYPIGSTQITGIIFEPWHYRYVGVEIAQEIMNLGITLEEYLGEG